MKQWQKEMLKAVGFVLAVYLVACLIVVLATPKEAAPADPLGLDGRTLVMVEGYGARCAVLYNANGMGAAGSGSIQCGWRFGDYSAYRGDWRRVQPGSR